MNVGVFNDRSGEGDGDDMTVLTRWKVICFEKSMIAGEASEQNEGEYLLFKLEKCDSLSHV